MPPWKEHQGKLVDNIRVGHVEVVLERRDRNVAIQLAKNSEHAKQATTHCHTHILFHVFLTCHHRRLSHLETHLRCRIVDETAERRRV